MTVEEVVRKVIADRISVIKSRYDLSTGDAHKKASDLGQRVSDLQLVERQILRDLAALEAAPPTDRMQVLAEHTLTPGGWECEGEHPPNTSPMWETVVSWNDCPELKRVLTADEHHRLMTYGYLDTAPYSGSSTMRQSVGKPGHCERCALVGHVLAHPDLGCGDVGCVADH